MKRNIIFLLLSVSALSTFAQSYKMVIRVNEGAMQGNEDNIISIPVDDIKEVTFEEVESIPESSTPITFQIEDYIAVPTRAIATTTSALTNRKYGVFGCYNNGEPINPSKVVANLINNQELKYIDGSWTYSPIVYWPEKNESSNYASFFAYSPYSENGNNEYVKVSSSSTPVIEYESTNPMNEAGDLLYGNSLNTTQDNNNGCVNIQSRHALAKLNLYAVGTNFESETKITIESITISGKIPNIGSFNLYSQQWENRSTDVQTYKLEGNTLSPELRDAGNKSAANQPVGVQTVSKQIGISPFLFIPTEGEQEITVTVKYYVTTDDPNLSSGYSRIQNVITKRINLKLEKSYEYDLKIILGLTSVKLDITSSVWGDSNNISF